MPSLDITPMHPSDIIEDWVNSDRRFPERAIASAMAQQDVMTPILLEEMRDIADHPDCLSRVEDYWIGQYALYLLAAFRDSRILPYLERLLHKTGGNFHGLWSDEASEDANRLFASWAFSDPGLLKRIVEDEKYGDIIRSEALEGLVILYHSGVIDRSALLSYLTRLGESVLRRERCESRNIMEADYESNDTWLWYTWSRICLELRFEELFPLVRTAYTEQWIDPTISSWDHEEKDFSTADDSWPERNRERLGGLIDDPVEELRCWSCFTPEELRKNRKREREEARNIPAGFVEPWRHPDTIINDGPKPKPNQPCLCGSGKKFKKCCGRK